MSAEMESAFVVFKEMESVVVVFEEVKSIVVVSEGRKCVSEDGECVVVMFKEESSGFCIQRRISFC